MQEQWSIYYIVFVIPEKMWFFSALLKSMEHMAFDRTLDPALGQVELFIAPDAVHDIEAFLHNMRFRGVVTAYSVGTNRLQKLRVL